MNPEIFIAQAALQAAEVLFGQSLDASLTQVSPKRKEFE